MLERPLDTRSANVRRARRIGVRTRTTDVAVIWTIKPARLHSNCSHKRPAVLPQSFALLLTTRRCGSCYFISRTQVTLSVSHA